jgi:hypothetical protein
VSVTDRRQAAAEQDKRLPTAGVRLVRTAHGDAHVRYSRLRAAARSISSRTRRAGRNVCWLPVPPRVDIRRALRACSMLHPQIRPIAETSSRTIVISALPVRPTNDVRAIALVLQSLPSERVHWRPTGRSATSCSGTAGRCCITAAARSIPKARAADRFGIGDEHGSCRRARSPALLRLRASRGTSRNGADQAQPVAR